MESESSHSNYPKPNKLIIGIIVAIILFCCVISVCLIGVGFLVFNYSSSISPQPINHKPDAFVDISINPDDCVVSRGEVQGSSEVTSLTWVITDKNGYAVLERNAENEFQYRYFQSGTFYVHIKAWFNGAYHQISDQVVIQCK